MYIYEENWELNNQRLLIIAYQFNCVEKNEFRLV